MRNRHTLLGIILGIGFTALLVSAPAAWAQPPGHDDDGYGNPHEGMMSSEAMGGGMSETMGGQMNHDRMQSMMTAENLKERLGLSDDQVDKLKALRNTYLKETTTQGAKVRVAEIELNELLDAAKPDAAKVEKKVREMESLRSDLTLSRVRFLLKTGDFLTPEQFKKFRAMTMGRMTGASHAPMKKMEHGTAMPGGSGMAPGMPPHQ